MIGIVIVSHANIAKEFLDVIEHIVGKQEKVFTVSIFPKDNMDKKRNFRLCQKGSIRQWCDSANRYVWWNPIQSSSLCNGYKEY